MVGDTFLASLEVSGVNIETMCCADVTGLWLQILFTLLTLPLDSDIATNNGVLLTVLIIIER